MCDISLIPLFDTVDTFKQRTCRIAHKWNYWMSSQGHAKKNGFKGWATPENMKKKGGGGSSEKKAMKKWYEVFIN